MAWGLTNMVMGSIRGGRGKGVSRAKELKSTEGGRRGGRKVRREEGWWRTSHVIEIKWFGILNRET